ncbi:short-chain dehydrogenase reductase 2 [Seiridium cupressi]
MASMLYSPTLDVAATLRQIIFSPLLSGSLLLAVTYAPNSVRDVIYNIARRLPGLHLSTRSLDLSTTTTALRTLLALSILRQLNHALGTMAANSWRLTPSRGWDWPSEIAVVTGGSSGIGKSIVEKLSVLGVRVAVLDVQDLPGSMKVDPRVRLFKCDVTSSESIAAAANAIRQEFGHPTILINNAGITRPMPILKMPESFLRKIFGVNCLSLWLTTQQFLPHMIQMNKGHVITVASIASFVALPMAADYSASKAGALAFHESLTCELKHCYKAPNVLTTVVQPNFVRTPLVEDFADHLERSGVRMLTSDDIAEPIVAQLKSRQGGQLIIPRSASPISGIRGWPTWLQELLRDVLGRQSLGIEDKYSVEVLAT